MWKVLAVISGPRSLATKDTDTVLLPWKFTAELSTTMITPLIIKLI